MGRMLWSVDLGMLLGRRSFQVHHVEGSAAWKTDAEAGQSWDSALKEGVASPIRSIRCQGILLGLGYVRFVCQPSGVDTDDKVSTSDF